MEYPSLDTAKAGAIRFNTDSSQMEIYDGNQWIGILATSSDLHTGGTRGLIMGGIISGRSNVVDFITVSTTGDVTEFGDLVQTASQGAGLGSRVRAIAGGGTPSTPSGTNNIDFHEFASTGNFNDFGDMVTTGFGRNAVASSTRGVFLGRAVAPNTFNEIEFVTIASTGSANDFGDLENTKHTLGVAGNQTRGIAVGGNPSKGTMEFITISTTGNGTDFGDCTVDIWNTRGSNCGNAVRGLMAGGGPGSSNAIQYVTISTLGNTVDFGDRTVAKSQIAHMSSTTRACFAGAGEGDDDTIDYVQIMTTGNAVDFGNLQSNYGYAVGASNGHGGL